MNQQGDAARSVMAQSSRITSVPAVGILSVSLTSPKFVPTKMDDLTYLLESCAECPHDYGDHGAPTTDRSCAECDCPAFQSRSDKAAQARDSFGGDLPQGWDQDPWKEGEST